MKDSKKYLKDIRRLFPIYGKNEQEFLSNIKNQMHSLGDCDYDTFVEELGEPTDIISSYYHEIETDDLMKKLNIKRIIKYIGIIIVIIVLLTCLWRTHVLNEAYEDFESGIPVEIEETIVEE